MPDIRDYDYIFSALGNGYFSGVSFAQAWQCVTLADTPEQFDAAITATIALNNIQCKQNNISYKKE